MEKENQESILRSLPLSYDEHDHTATFTMTANNVDEDGDIIEPAGMDTSWWEKNGSVLFGHNPHDPNSIVGKPMQVTNERENGFDTKRVKIKFNPHTEMGRAVENMVRDGFLNGGSVRFRPMEGPGEVRDETGHLIGRHFKRSKLLEFSLTPIPANHMSTSKAISKSLADYLVDKEFSDETIQAIVGEDVEKGAVPYSESPKADENHPWDGGAAKKRIHDWAKGSDGKVDMKKYQKCFAWRDMSSDNLGSCKLPYKDIIDGKPTMVWAGVRAAMGALLGARGGTKIPSGDRKGVYNVLAKAYRAFEKDPPEFKHFNDYELMKMFPEKYPIEVKMMKRMKSLAQQVEILNERFEALSIDTGAILRSIGATAPAKAEEKKEFDAEAFKKYLLGKAAEKPGKVPDEVFETNKVKTKTKI